MHPASGSIRRSKTELTRDRAPRGTRHTRHLANGSASGPQSGSRVSRNRAPCHLELGPDGELHELKACYLTTNLGSRKTLLIRAYGLT